jgi:hypothetical protein
MPTRHLDTPANTGLRRKSKSPVNRSAITRPLLRSGVNMNLPPSQDARKPPPRNRTPTNSANSQNWTSTDSENTDNGSRQYPTSGFMQSAHDRCHDASPLPARTARKPRQFPLRPALCSTRIPLRHRSIHRPLVRAPQNLDRGPDPPRRRMFRGGHPGVCRHEQSSASGTADPGTGHPPIQRIPPELDIHRLRKHRQRIEAIPYIRVYAQRA